MASNEGRKAYFVCVCVLGRELIRRKIVTYDNEGSGWGKHKKESYFYYTRVVCSIQMRAICRPPLHILI
jgi:inosine/xanthosine triphosphate pyrophosphatase family protein